MKRLLIIKTGAAGDVVRTTVLVRCFKDWDIDWLVSPENQALLRNVGLQRVFTDTDGLRSQRPYDLVVSLEDDERFLRDVYSRIEASHIFGSSIGSDGHIGYTDDSAEWFNLSLISRYGIEKANELKLRNRKSYQEIIIQSLGQSFEGQRYIMPGGLPVTDCRGDIAIAAKAGDRWPIKTWAYFERLKDELSREFTVNALPQRRTLQEHLADVRQHRLLVTPDSLPMHIAVGFGIPTIGLFTCTSPWEIYDYGVLTKVVSPLLEKYFYSREFHKEAVTSIPYEEVLQLVRGKMDAMVRQKH